MMTASLREGCSWSSWGWKRPRTPIRISWARALGFNTRARNRRGTTLPSTRLILHPAEHAARRDGRGGSGHGMNADKEQKLGLVCREHCDNEPVAGSCVRMGTGGSAGLHKGVHMLQRAANSLSGTVASRLLHTGEDFANDRLIAAMNELEVCASHFERRDWPMITEAHQWRTRQSGIGRVQTKAFCCRNQLFARQIFREGAEIRIARDRNGGNKIQFSVRVHLPATAGFTPANVTWKLILESFPVSDSRERFDERAEWDGPGGVVPTRRQKGARASIQEEIGNVTTGKLPFEHKNCRLTKKRLRRWGGILSRGRDVRKSGKTICHREHRDEEPCS